MPGAREFYSNGNGDKPVDDASHDRGIFSVQPNPEARFIEDHDELARKVEAFKEIGLHIVMTSGSFDMIHIGHARYLEQAKNRGEVLIVGLDSDAKVQQRKGENRPVVPEDERIQMLAHLKSVDIITLKQPDEPKWGLIKKIKPDTLIVTEETYDDATLKELAEICGRVVCLEPQALTSTSAQIRLLQIGWVDEIIEPVSELLEKSGVDTGTIVAIEALLKELQK